MAAIVTRIHFVDGSDGGGKDMPPVRTFLFDALAEMEGEEITPADLYFYAVPGEILGPRPITLDDCKKAIALYRRGVWGGPIRLGDTMPKQLKEE